MSEELTPWFPPDIKPVRPGIYQTTVKFRSDGAPYWLVYAIWTGIEWFFDHGGPLWIQHVHWRGLAEKP